MISPPLGKPRSVAQEAGRIPQAARGGAGQFAGLLQPAPQASAAPAGRAVFERWWTTTLAFEGTLAAWRARAANRVDRGGPTNLGITERTFAACAKAAGLANTREAFEALTPAQAKPIALALWRTSRADQLADPGVALVVGDWFWGSNTRAWAKMKAALSAAGHEVTPGPELDPASIALLNGLPPREAINLLSAARREHHAAIVRADPTQRVFLAGWQRRTDAREALALELCAEAGAPPLVESPLLEHVAPTEAREPALRSTSAMPHVETAADALTLVHLPPSRRRESQRPSARDAPSRAHSEPPLPGAPRPRQ